MSPRPFLYAEIPVSVPFDKIDWPAINVAMKKEPGLKSKTWLSGVNNHTIGGFYEFDSLEHAEAYAAGFLSAAAQQIGGSLSGNLFDGEVVKEASAGANAGTFNYPRRAVRFRSACCRRRG
jgi:hypothetical protein